EQVSDSLLQGVHAGILAILVVANGSRGHRGPHFLARQRHRIGTQIDDHAMGPPWSAFCRLRMSSPVRTGALIWSSPWGREAWAPMGLTLSRMSRPARERTSASRKHLLLTAQVLAALVTPRLDWPDVAEKSRLEHEVTVIEVDCRIAV